ncbi:cytochrome C [Geobacter pelophilus]|uniref:nitrite reductase (cytochrome; ammonia-forming) n=1 Tax=Geoanaerobacter pelophilus TaxID=60036 RepID=A0AAW4KW56_9BACT|nr:cytochrome c3 family protein [Geoanaerobacter pelophilus]MBT0662791.1 cytochrome C [Geoanaerobacter pelophilus]
MAYLISIVLLVMSLSVATAQAASSFTPFHLDRQKLPYGCGSCHVGFEFRSGGGQEGCLSCHGNPAKRKTGLIRSTADLVDFEKELKKTYHHPILESKNLHSNKEILPEIDHKAPRHSDCVDCHSPHLVSSSNKFAGIKGKKNGNILTDVTTEYQLCYLCHSDSANLPGRFVNKRIEFAVSNPSFHPIEGEGKNLAVVSLIRPYKEKKTTANDVSVLKCGDCHGSDDANSPAGPHSSIYQYILRENYSARDNETESIFAYSLCYKCHNRNSILADESFKFHSMHIKGKKSSMPGNGGTSCHTCHTSHGSTENRYLIRFNTDIVSASSSGMLKFKEKGAGTFRGECFLTCHGVDHNPKSY